MSSSRTIRRLTLLPWTQAYKYLIAGGVLGFLFPIVATIIKFASSPAGFNISSIVNAHATDPLLWIMDAAPMLLGLAGFLAGHRQDRMQKLNWELAQSHNELRTEQSELEQRVDQQSRELAAANSKLIRRTEQLRLITDIANSSTAIQEIDQLLDFVTRTLGERFGFADVSIFLIDEQKQYAVLSAASSAAARSMMDGGYRLQVGASGIVAHAVQIGQPSLTRDMSALYPDQPDPSGTRSAVALPLIAGDVILGVLVIQAADADAFPEEDMATLSILADQMAVSIQNAVTHEKSQRALRDPGLASERVSGRAFRHHTEAPARYGYRYDGVRSEPLRGPVASTDSINEMHVPVRLRGQIIGHIKLIHSDLLHRWTEDEVAMAEATAERVALSLEAARLLEDAQRRAARESFLSEISARLGSSFQLDSILRDTVEELGQTLRHSTVTFQLVGSSAFDGHARASENDGSTMSDEQGHESQ